MGSSKTIDLAIPMSIPADPMLLQATEPVSIRAVVILLAAMATGMALARKDRRALEPSGMIRVPTPNDVAPAWIVLGGMMLIYVYAPILIRSFVRTNSAAASQPPTEPADPATLILVGLFTYLIAIVGCVAIHFFLRSPARRLLGLEAPSLKQWRLLGIACLVAIPLTYLTSMVNVQVIDALGIEHPTRHPMLEWMTQFSDRPGIRIAAILSATLFAPVFEELFFRGHLQTGLVSTFKHRWMAIVVTSAVFASLHPAWTMAPIFVLSCCLGWAYERTNNLWIAIALHVAFNAVSTAVYLARG